MADNISNIIDPSNFTEIDKLIDRIVALEGEVEKANSKSIAIQVDLKGADNLQALTDATKEAQTAIQQLNVVVKENNAVVQQSANVSATYGENVSEMAGSLAEQKRELTYINEQIKYYSKNLAEGINLGEDNVGLIADWTKRQQELKIEISATTSAIKTEIKEINAATGSMDEMSQTLFQLKERFRALSAEERSNAEIGGKLNAQISQLDAELKQLDSTIGNSQRNVGNYGIAFKSVSAELTFTKAKMQELAVAGKAGEAEYKALSIRANELSAAQRQVGAETGRAVFSIENAGRRIETMIFRMAIHFAIFAGVIEILKSVGDAWEKYTNRINMASKAQEDISNNLNNSFQQEATNLSILKDRFEAVGATMEDKKEVVKLLNDAIKDQYGAINNVNDAEKFFVEKSKAFIEALTLRAEAQANLTLLTKEYEEQAKMNANPEAQLQWWDKLNAIIHTTGISLQSLFGRGPAQGTPQEIYDWQKAMAAANITSASLGDSYDKQAFYLKNMLKLQREAAEIDVKNKFHTEEVDKNKKETRSLDDIALIQDMEREKQRLKQEADVQKQIVDDEKAGLEERLNANVAYLGKLLTINAIELKMDKDKENTKIENAKKNQDKYAVGSHNFQVEQHIIDEANKKKLTLDEQYNYQAQVLAEKSKKEISRIYLSNENQFITDQKEALTRQLINIEDATLEQQAALKKRYDDGEINAKTYNKDLEKIQRASNDNIINTEISFLTNLLSSTDTIIQKHHDEIEARIRQLKKQQIQNVHDKEKYTPEGAIPSLEAAVHSLKEEPTDIKSQAQINIETLQKFAAFAIEIYRNLYDSIKQMRDNEFAKEQMQIEIQQRQLEITSQQKLRAIDATTGFSIQKDNEKAKVAAETTAKENELQAKSNQLQLKKAKADKEAAEAGILMNTALAITKALVLLPTDPALAVAEIAIITATGAAQYAAAASAPLPQFRYGTDATKTPLFIAGEAGEQEWIQTPDGKGEWSGTQAKVFHKPIGTSVTPISKIVEYAKNNVTSTAVENATFAIQLQLDKDKANYRYLVDQLAKKSEDNTEDIVNAIYNTKGNLKPVINVNMRNDLQF